MNFWQITGQAVGYVVLIIVALFLWRLAMEKVEDEILRIRRKAREENSQVKPWVATAAQSRFWFVVAMALAPIILVGYGAFLIVALISLEIWSYITEDSKVLKRRLRRQ